MRTFQKVITVVGLFLALPYVLDYRRVMKELTAVRQDEGVLFMAVSSLRTAINGSNTTSLENVMTIITSQASNDTSRQNDQIPHSNTALVQTPQHSAQTLIKTDSLPRIVQSFHNSTVRIVSNLDNETKAAIHARLSSAPTWPLLPSWAQDYLQWHAEMRTQFPDTELLTNPEAPGVVISICIELCGGTHDRLGKVEHAMAFAALTNRVVMWKWHVPAALEAFLEPHLCNWTAPLVAEFEKDYLKQHRPTFVETFLNRNMALHQVIRGQPVDGHKVVYIRKNISNGRVILAAQLKLDQKSVLGAVFRSLFRPSAALQSALDKVYREVNLTPGNYTAAHCRVRHPGFYGHRATGKVNGQDADASGLIFEGVWKEKATRAALMGVQCAARLRQNDAEPIYFMSDEEQVVAYVVHGKGGSGGGDDNATAAVDAAMAAATREARVVARNVTARPTLHIDNQPGHPPEYYMDTFVDLYLAINARCVSFGVGNFGYFASKISGTTCTQVHSLMANRKEMRKWNQQNGGAPMCNIKGIP